MKKLILFLLPILLLASCQQYDNSIYGTKVTLGSFVPTYDSAGVTIGTIEQMDTSYLVSPTWTQAWKWSGERNNHLWVWVGIGIIVFASAGFIFYNNKGDASIGLVVPLCIALLVGGSLIGGSVEWEKWNMDQEISKAAYDQYMKDPGNLGPFWETIRIK